MILMEKNLKAKMNECLELTKKYELPVQKIKKDIQFMDNFFVTLPVIGGFSTGKSSMINALLGQKLLKTHIGAETAVPTEIMYGAQSITIHKDDQTTALTLEQFQDREFTVEDTDYIQITLEQPFLKEISTVKLVDMPGFDSGITAHNTAIDHYLPNSLAYILTFAADDPVVKESIANFLKEIKLHNLPVYVVVTKSDKVTEETLQTNLQAIQLGVEKHLGVKPKKTVAVWSKKNRNTEFLQEILLDVQQNSMGIYQEYFTKALQLQSKMVLKYLETRLRSTELTVSELDEKESSLRNQLNDLQEKIKKEQQKFGAQFENAVVAIQQMVDRQLHENIEALENALVRGEDIQQRMNTIIRNAVTVGIKTEFEPKIQQHLLNIAELLRVEDINTNIRLDSMQIQTDTMLKELAVKAIPIILGAIGVALTGPIGGLIIAASAIIAELFFNKKRQNDIKAQASQRLHNEIFPTVLSEVSMKIESELRSYVEQIHDVIQEEVEQQHQLLQQALQDVRIEKQQNDELQYQMKKEIEQDMEAMKEWVQIDTVAV